MIVREGLRQEVVERNIGDDPRDPSQVFWQRETTCGNGWMLIGVGIDCTVQTNPLLDGRRADAGLHAFNKVAQKSA